ncbi:hypothetical protein GF386_02265 [Candidatus Pacearchaeota archaeon]|nr:hypothetical protein [Candidatus Pacearchaeota archaeon]
MDTEKFNNLVAVLAIVIVLIALVNLSTTLIRVSELREGLTGYATGYVNITISEMISLDLLNDTIEWGAGVVNESFLNSTLITYADNITGYVEQGNWTCTDCTGFTIENVGSVNFTLNISSNVNATNLLGTQTANLFQWNMTEKETGTCASSYQSNDVAWGQFADVNVTGAAGIFCTNFSYLSGEDEVYLDFKLRVDQGVEPGTKTALIDIQALSS